MAIRKKSETIHLRVKPTSKAFLEGLSNSADKTATQVIEELIAEAASKVLIKEIGPHIDKRALVQGKLTLENAIIAAHYPDEPLLTKLRTFYIASEALDSRDRTIAEVILLNNLEEFSGTTKIFTATDGIISRKYLANFPSVSLEKIHAKMDLLEEFAKFRETNPGWKSDFNFFLKMVGVKDD